MCRSIKLFLYISQSDSIIIVNIVLSYYSLYYIYPLFIPIIDVMSCILFQVVWSGLGWWHWKMITWIWWWWLGYWRWWYATLKHLISFHHSSFSPPYHLFSFVRNSHPISSFHLPSDPNQTLLARFGSQFE